jgi:DNA-directed RNA polymerase subunit delta
LKITYILSKIGCSIKFGGIKMENISEMALIDVAYNVVKEASAPMHINDIIDKVFELKGIEKTNELVSKLYVDLTASSKFVFMGDGLWDLKEKQSLEEFDKDGSAFCKEDPNAEPDDEEEIEIEEDEDEDSDDDSDDDDDEDEDEDSDEEDDDDSEDEYEFDDEEESEDESEDDELDDDDSNDFEEDKYNKYMDDYEDMYEN